MIKIDKNILKKYCELENIYKSQIKANIPVLQKMNLFEFYKQSLYTLIRLKKVFKEEFKEIEKIADNMLDIDIVDDLLNYIKLNEKINTKRQ